MKDLYGELRSIEDRARGPVKHYEKAEMAAGIIFDMMTGEEVDPGEAEVLTQRIKDATGYGVNTSVVIDSIQGKTFQRVEKTIHPKHEKDALAFWLDDASGFFFAHKQDCCEEVWLEDVCGDLSDLESVPIIEATRSQMWATLKESYNSEVRYQEEATWTFDTFRTEKGSVTVRWCGTSNGCYAEAAGLGSIEGGEWDSYWWWD